MVSISDLGDYIGSGSQGSVWQHASEPDKIIKVMKGFPVMNDGELDAFQYDRYLQRRFGSKYDQHEQAAWMFAPMANKMVLYLFQETMAMRKDNLALPSGQVKVYAIENQIFELKDMRRLYQIIVNNGVFGEASDEAKQFKLDWLTILSPGHRNGYLMVQEKLERIGGRSRAEGQERPKVFEEWSTFLWDDFGLVTRDTKNPGNYGFRANKELVIYDPVVAPLPEQNDWSSRNVFNRLRYAYFVYLFTDIPKINDIDEYDAHEVNKIIRRFERQIIAGNFYRIEREAEGFPGSYQPEPSLNDYGLRDIMYSGTASDNFQQTLANFGSDTDEGWEDDVEWTQDNKKKIPKWQEEVEWNAPAPKQTKVRFPRAKADKIVATVEAHIKPYVEKMMACGSYRRGAQMIGDIDFVVILKDGYTLPQILPPNQGINWVGEQKAQVIIDGEKVDFRVTTPEAWGATILYFTGPADFNIKYRWMAKKRGLKLSEYGLFKRDTDEYIAGATEADIFTALGRPYRDPADRKGFQRSAKKKAEAFDNYDNWHEDMETMNEEKWKLYKQQGGKTPITNKTSKKDRKLLNDIIEELGWSGSKQYTIDTPTMAYRAMPFTDYAKALETGYLYPPQHGIFASLNPTPTRAQASWKGYPVFEIDITGLTVTFKGKQGDEQGRIITIDEPISVDRILHYGKNIYEGWEAESFEAPYQPNQSLADYSPQDLMTSSAVTGDFTTDSLKYGFGPTVLRGEMEEYAPNETDDSFTSMSNLAYITLPDYDESYYWISDDENSRATVAFDEENEVIIIPNFEVSLRVRGQGMASQYLHEMIDDLHSDFGYYPVQVIDVDNHAIGFWEKMQNQGVIDGWTQGRTFDAEDDYRAEGFSKDEFFKLYKKLTGKVPVPVFGEWTDFGDEDTNFMSSLNNFQIFTNYGGYHEFKEAESQLPICPICEGYIPNNERPGAYPGATSRYDNKTEICSACGTTEAVAPMILGDEIYVLRDEAQEFTDDPWEIWCYIMANAKDQMPPVFLGRTP